MGTSRTRALASLLFSAWLLVAAAPSPASAATAPYPKYLPPCQPVVVINVRGSGQQGPKVINAPSHGLPRENPGRAVLEHLATLVGGDAWARVSLTDLPYEAIKVSVSIDYVAFEYENSRKDGEQTLGLYLSVLHSRCPAAKIVLVGYSQGADVIGEQLPRVETEIRKKIAGIALFGDPRFNPRSAAAQGTFNPNRWGIRGARPEFPSGVAVQSYCRSLDPVCQGLVGARVTRGAFGLPVVTTEASLISQHTSYHEHEAQIAAQWLRAQLSRLGLLSLPAPTASLTPLDVSFVIDSTGSMSDAIESVRTNVGAIRQQLAAQSTSFAAALTEYRDEPAEDSTFQARLLTDLTADESAFAAALAEVDADGGGDWPESVLAGLNQAMSVSWRKDVSKAVVLVGDAPPKDPEPVTSSTLESTIRRANLLGLPVHTMIVGEDEDTIGAFSALSRRSSGISVNVENPNQVAQAIVGALQANAGAPIASLTRASADRRTTRSTVPPDAVQAGYVGVPILLSAGASSSPLGDALVYTWDFGDGTSVTTPSAVVAHTWSRPYDGDVTLTVTDSAGRTGRTVQAIAIFDGAPRGVTAPSGVRVQPGPGTLTVRWTRPRFGQPLSYDIVDGTRTVGILTPTNNRTRLRLSLPKPTPCRRMRLRVVATDALGRRAASAPPRAVLVKPVRYRTTVRNGKRVQRRVAGSCRPSRR